MRGLAEISGDPTFTVDRTWTTRPQRYGEHYGENHFIDTRTFEAQRSNFLFTFQTFPTYEYGIIRPEPVSPYEVRMRILMPIHALKFRQMVPEPTYLCSIAPFRDPKEVFRARDPHSDPADIAARVARFESDQVDADRVADLRFQNSLGITTATETLSKLVLSYIEHNARTEATASSYDCSFQDSTDPDSSAHTR